MVYNYSYSAITIQVSTPKIAPRFNPRTAPSTGDRWPLVDRSLTRGQSRRPPATLASAGHVSRTRPATQETSARVLSSFWRPLTRFSRPRGSPVRCDLDSARDTASRRQPRRPGRRPGQRRRTIPLPEDRPKTTPPPGGRFSIRLPCYYGLLVRGSRPAGFRFSLFRSGRKVPLGAIAAPVYPRGVGRFCYCPLSAWSSVHSGGWLQPWRSGCAVVAGGCWRRDCHGWIMPLIRPYDSPRLRQRRVSPSPDLAAAIAAVLIDRIDRPARSDAAAIGAPCDHGRPRRLLDPCRCVRRCRHRRCHPFALFMASRKMCNAFAVPSRRSAFQNDRNNRKHSLQIGAPPGAYSVACRRPHDLHTIVPSPQCPSIGPASSILSPLLSVRPSVLPRCVASLHWSPRRDPWHRSPMRSDTRFQCPKCR